MSDYGIHTVKFHDSVYTTLFSRTQPNSCSMVYVINFEFIQYYTLYKVRTRLDPMNGGVTIWGRTPRAV